MGKVEETEKRVQMFYRCAQCGFSGDIMRQPTVQIKQMMWPCKPCAVLLSTWNIPSPSVCCEFPSPCSLAFCTLVLYDSFTVAVTLTFTFIAFQWTTSTRLISVNKSNKNKKSNGGTPGRGLAKKASMRFESQTNNRCLLISGILTENWFCLK